LKRYKYVVATRGQYFAVKGGYERYKKFLRVMSINKHNSLIGLLEALRMNGVHYTVVTKEVNRV